MCNGRLRSTGILCKGFCTDLIRLFKGNALLLYGIDKNASDAFRKVFDDSLLPAELGFPMSLRSL